MHFIQLEVFVSERTAAHKNRARVAFSSEFRLSSAVRTRAHFSLNPHAGSATKNERTLCAERLRTPWKMHIKSSAERRSMQLATSKTRIVFIRFLRLSWAHFLWMYLRADVSKVHHTGTQTEGCVLNEGVVVCVYLVVGNLNNCVCWKHVCSFVQSFGIFSSPISAKFANSLWYVNNPHIHAQSYKYITKPSRLLYTHIPYVLWILIIVFRLGGPQTAARSQRVISACAWHLSRKSCACVVFKECVRAHRSAFRLLLLLLRFRSNWARLSVFRRKNTP